MLSFEPLYALVAKLVLEIQEIPLWRAMAWVATLKHSLVPFRKSGCPSLSKTSCKPEREKKFYLGRRTEKAQRRGRKTTKEKFQFLMPICSDTPRFSSNEKNIFCARWMPMQKHEEQLRLSRALDHQNLLVAFATTDRAKSELRA